MVDIYSIITKFFQEGGFFIYPIAVVLALGLAISLERWVFLTRERIRNAKAFDAFLPLIRTNDLEKMQLFTRDTQTPVTRILGCGIDMMKVSKQRADIENAMSEGMLETIPKLESRTSYLAVLANVATLLGLLGTIIGLIAAFTAVANADPAEKSKLLSSSISVAMNTTAFGLVSAIPLLIIHAILQNKTSAIVASIEMSAVKFLNVMTLNRAIEAGIVRPVQSSAQSSVVINNEPVNLVPEDSLVEATPEVQGDSSGYAEGSVAEVASADESQNDDHDQNPDVNGSGEPLDDSLGEQRPA